MVAARMTVDLNRLIKNWQLFDDRVFRGSEGRGLTGAVLKADAYGLGAEVVGQALYKEGCRQFFVAHGTEGVLLRKTLDYPDAVITVFHGCRPGEEELFRHHRLIPVLNSIDDIKRYADLAALEGASPAVLHVDTGMNRLGLAGQDFKTLMSSPELATGLDICMIMTHLVAGDVPADRMNLTQKNEFDTLMAARPDWLRGARLSMANSAGVLNGGDYIYDIARVGIGLYGGNPFTDLANPLNPVVRLEAEILQVREIEVGETVSYNGIWRAASKSRTATIGLGYADGVMRSASPGAEVMIKGQRAPVVGRVTMDLTMIDISAFENDVVKAGDMVELCGDHLPVDDLAAASQTIGYEVLTSFGRMFESGRLERHYYKS